MRSAPAWTMPGDDPGLADVLRALGVASRVPLGRGGEAMVYALDADRVVRILHDGTSPDDLGRRRALVDELRATARVFDLPEVISIGEIEGRPYSIERRLAGRSVMTLLGEETGRERERLVERHLDAAAALGGLHLEPRRWWGDLLDPRPVRAPRWREYLRRRAAASLRRAPSVFAAIDAEALADELPDCATPAFVHLDAFAGNMLAVGSTISAVIDIGPTSLVGDARLDPVAAAVYLGSAQITPVGTQRDVEVAASWLRSAGLVELLEPVRRWLAAYWSWAVDDEDVHDWCRSVLVGA